MIFILTFHDKQTEKMNQEVKKTGTDFEVVISQRKLVELENENTKLKMDNNSLTIINENINQLNKVLADSFESKSETIGRLVTENEKLKTDIQQLRLVIENNPKVDEIKLPWGLLRIDDDTISITRTDHCNFDFYFNGDKIVIS